MIDIVEILTEHREFVEGILGWEEMTIREIEIAYDDYIKGVTNE
jgi:hypothetical protein